MLEDDAISIGSRVYGTVRIEFISVILVWYSLNTNNLFSISICWMKQILMPLRKSGLRLVTGVLQDTVATNHQEPSMPLESNCASQHSVDGGLSKRSQHLNFVFWSFPLSFGGNKHIMIDINDWFTYISLVWLKAICIGETTKGETNCNHNDLFSKQTLHYLMINGWYICIYVYIYGISHLGHLQ